MYHVHIFGGFKCIKGYIELGFMLYVVLGMPTLKFHYAVPRKCNASRVVFYCLQRDMLIMMILKIL